MFRHILHPHTLPDPALRCIPHTAAFQRLLSHSIIRSIRQVPDNYLKQIFSFLHICGYVIGKMPVTARMLSHLMSVHIYLTGLVHCPKMQKQTFSALCPRQRKLSFIVKKHIRHKYPVHAGKNRLRRERYKDPAVIRFRKLHRICDGIVPISVQDLIPVSFHSRSGILLQNMLRIDFFSPFCQNSIAHISVSFLRFL